MGILDYGDVVSGAGAAARECVWAVARRRRFFWEATMTQGTNAQAARDLTNLLGLAAQPIAITFSADAPAGVEPFGVPMAAPTPAGRTGRVPAGCVFWMHATERTFTTVAE